jgi:predicted MPP superfamily phosphohydrolase
MFKSTLLFMLIYVATSSNVNANKIQVNHWQVDSGLKLETRIAIMHMTDIHYREESGQAVINNLVSLVAAHSPDLILLGGLILARISLKLKHSCLL